MRRRLSAVMSADVAGYSALMAADEEGTLARLKAHREELIEPAIAAHGGRIVKLMGDGLLMEFPSVVEAVRAGVEIQREGAARNQVVADDHQIVFRIGINQGDVIVDGDDIYGGGVNVAARLQERAAPGGICISDRVYGDIRGRIDVGIDDLGDQELKNIPEPVRVYRVLMGPDDGGAELLGSGMRFGRRGVAVAAASSAFVLLVGLAVWYWASPSGPAPFDLVGAAKPSIAVLPFANLSENPEEEYFSDGMTNDIITDLSKFNDLLVIASNTVFTYKGKAVNVRDVSQELGVRYVLEGSVLKLGDRVRINAQLVDGESGRHLWAERYDEAIADIFELQGEISGRIVRTLAVRVTEIEEKLALAKSTDNLEAYDYALRGRALLVQFERSENFEARKLYRRAIELDRDYASAYAGLGFTHLYSVWYGWTESPQRAVQEAHDLAKKALSLETSNIDGHVLLAWVYTTRGQLELALVESERLIALNPNDAHGFATQGTALVRLGRPTGAILALENALRIDPKLDPAAVWNLGLAYYLEERYADAAVVEEENLVRRPEGPFDYLMLAATYAQMGRAEEARRAAEAVRRLDPYRHTLNNILQLLDPAGAARLKEGFRKAGLE